MTKMVETGQDALPASAAVWLADEAIYRRTSEGQRELVCETHRLAAPERRLLCSVTGHTPLRVLIDLGLHAADMGRAIYRLIELRMIELVEWPDH